MKRIICFVLCIVLILPLTVFIGFAENTDREESFVGAVSFTCEYNAKDNKIIIDGTVSHDFMKTHENYTIKAYAIEPNQDYREVINDPSSTVLAQTQMTVKFTFGIAIKSIEERYFKYAIVLSSENGKNYIAGQPMLPSIPSEFKYNSEDRSAFKGICTDSSINVGNSGAGTVIVDIDIDKTVGDSTDSILYPMKDTYIHIRKSYIETIDKQVMIAELNGARVYLRLLLSADSASAYSLTTGKTKCIYSIPDLYDQNNGVLEYIAMISDFLAGRYNGDNGKVCGMILGSKIDDIKYSNAIGTMDLDEYAELYVLYLTVVANAVRAIDPSFDMVIPFSNTNDYNLSRDGDNITPSILLESIVERLDQNVSGDFSCTLLIESDISPLELTDNAEFTLKDNTGYIMCNNVQGLINYLDNLSSYNSVPSNIIYMWNPDKQISGKELCCAYVYSYLMLAPEPYVSAFALNIDSVSYELLEHIMQQIDTPSSKEAIAPLCQYLTADTWENFIGSSIDYEKMFLRKVFNSEFLSSVSANFIGEFQYIDFNASATYEMMSAGDNCHIIRSDYKALNIDTTPLKMGTWAQVFGVFDNAESYEFTPYISLTFEITDKNASTDALYEILLTLGSEDREISASGVVTSGTEQTLYFDVSEFTDDLNNAEHIKISARCLSKDTDGFSIRMYNMKGHSDQYTSDVLENLINARRLEINDGIVDDSDGFNYAAILTFVGVILGMVIIGVGLILIFGRESDHGQK